MLTTLRIKNLALVTDLSLDLEPGYNVITGETGAGKSIIIGALNLVLGERADRSLIRSGSDSCSVEAMFETAGLHARLGQVLDEHGLEPCENGQLVLKRTFTGAGSNRQFVNGSPATLAALSVIGEWLVDMHGPHDHQSLLHSARQLAILDAFCGAEPERELLAGLVQKRAKIEGEKAALIIDERTYAEQLDRFRFQTNEITAARLQPGEDERIDAEYRRASNGARLLQLSQAALDLISESDTSLQSQAAAMGRTVLELRRIDPGAESLVSLHQQALESLWELRQALSHYADKLDIDPARLQELEDRLNLLQSLKRKYGGTIAGVIEFGEEAGRRLLALEQRDEELVRLNAALNLVSSELLQAGEALSAKRRKAIPQLAKAVSKQLAELGFQKSRFDVSLSSSTEVAAATATGFDTAEFQFAPNPGEPAKPLRAIASSGELARVMLALKTVLAAEDEIPVLVFDEVDANVGGETANAVGRKMRQIAAKRQVLCITHLPQVAAPASAHYIVNKQVKSGRTISEIHRLENEERVTELARMLGGQTAAARNHAQSLLEGAR